MLRAKRTTKLDRTVAWSVWADRVGPQCSGAAFTLAAIAAADVQVELSPSYWPATSFGLSPYMGQPADPVAWKGWLDGTAAPPITYAAPPKDTSIGVVKHTASW